jgi:cytochrome c biogenesis protein ResB
MKFGILLLALLAAVSIFGSVIPQNEPVMTYVREYPDTY